MLRHIAADGRGRAAAPASRSRCAARRRRTRVTLPLLVGLGVDELSVGAARVGPVRAWVRALRTRARPRRSRGAALQASSARRGASAAPARDAARRLEPYSSVATTPRERVERALGGVVAVGAQA